MSATGAELRKAAERDLVEVWRALSTRPADPTAGTAEHDGLILTSTGVALAFFNGAFLHDRCDPATALQQARAFFGARRLPYLLRVPPEREDVVTMARDAGLGEVAPLPLMALRLPSTLPAAPAGLAVEPVIDAAGLSQHTDVLAEAFRLSGEVMRRYLGQVPLEDGRLTALNGRMDGAVVASSAAFVCDGVVGVYDVATRPTHRRRGLAETMTWAALRLGAERGADVAVLQPSPSGHAVYDRMGFSVVTQWRQFVDRPKE